MKEIDEYFSAVAPRPLYHYTSVGALLKIVESRKLLASHVYYLNDSKEIVHATNILTDVVSKFSDIRTEDERIFLRQLSSWLLSMRNTAYGVFVFSLSEERNLLSQWRAYTPHGKGVSIEFQPEFIGGLMQKAGLRLARCIYPYEEQLELAKTLVDKIFESFRTADHAKLPIEHPSNKHFGFLETFRSNLLQVLAVMKHESFAEEREWRLISAYYPSFKGPHLKFREGSSMLMPYMEVPFPELPEKVKPFSKITLGPTREPNLSFQALSSYLSNTDACAVTVNSGIPYRQW